MKTDYYNTVVKKRAKVRQRILARMKQMSGCVDCGYNENPLALQFDHVRGTKKFHLSYAPYAYSMRVILDEMDKCVVRCANCHMIKTHG